MKNLFYKSLVLSTFLLCTEQLSAAAIECNISKVTSFYGGQTSGIALDCYATKDGHPALINHRFADTIYISSGVNSKITPKPNVGSVIGVSIKDSYVKQETCQNSFSKGSNGGNLPFLPNTTYCMYTLTQNNDVIATQITTGADKLAPYGSTSNTTYPGNVAPVITEGANHTVTMSEDNSPTAFSLTLNASDKEKEEITWSIKTNASNGNASVSSTPTGTSQVINYTPNANYNGNDSFIVQTQDSSGNNSTITINVTINAVNDAPTITSTPITSVKEGDKYTYNLSAIDIEDDKLSWSANSALPSWLTLESGINYKFQLGKEANTADDRVGSADGEFKYPYSVTYNKEIIYVADSGNNRIQKFDKDGNYISNFGTKGTKDGEFGIISDITFDNDENIYIVENDNNRIQKLDINGKFISKLATEGRNDGEIFNPIGIAIDSKKNIYVADSGNNRIQKFDKDGKFLLKIGKANNESGNNDAEFNSPMNIAIDSNDNIYVVDGGNNRIQKFDKDGKFLLKIGKANNESGNNNAEFNNPTGIAIDKRDIIYVVDGANNRIQKFDKNGKFLSKFGTPGSEDGKLMGPFNIYIDDNYNIYITEPSFSRVQKFTQSTLSGTANKDNIGKHPISLNLSDNTNTVQHDFTITVECVNNCSNNSGGGNTNTDQPKLTKSIPDQLIKKDDLNSFNLNISTYFENTVTYSFNEINNQDLSSWLELNTSSGVFTIKSGTNSSSLTKDKYYIKVEGKNSDGTAAKAYFTLRAKDVNASLDTYIDSSKVSGASKNTGTEDGKNYSESKATINNKETIAKVYNDGSAKHSIEDIATATSNLPDSTVNMEANGDITTSTSSINEEGKTLDIEVTAKASGEDKAIHKLTVEGKDITARSKLPNAQTTINADRSVETSVSTASASLKAKALASGKAEHEVTVSGKTSKASVDLLGASTTIKSDGSVETAISISKTDSNNCGGSYYAEVTTNEEGKNTTKFKNTNESCYLEPTLDDGEAFPIGSESKILEENGGIHIQTTTPVLSSETKFKIK